MILASALLSVLVLQAAPPGLPRPFIERDVAGPMRDGVVLRADVRRPAAGPFPTLVYRTPYGKRLRGVLHRSHAVERGYAVVAPGRPRPLRVGGASSSPYRQRRPRRLRHHRMGRGATLVERRVGTFGLSYPGRRAVAGGGRVATPPEGDGPGDDLLHRPRNFFYSGGVWDPIVACLDLEQHRARPACASGLPGPKTGEEARAAWPARGSPPAGSRSTRCRHSGRAEWYYEWMKHPAGDAWWDWAELTDKYRRHQRCRAEPDGMARRGLRTARRDDQLLRAAGGARGQSDRAPRCSSGRGSTEERTRTAPANACSGPRPGSTTRRASSHFLDRHVRGLARTARRPRSCAPSSWARTSGGPANTLPLPGTSPSRSISRRRANSRHPLPARDAASSGFVSDPLRPVVDPFAADATARTTIARSRPDRTCSSSRRRLSPSDLRVVGAVETEIYLSADAPDADLWVKLEDVAPDGTAWNLSSPGTDVLRASDRDGESPPAPLASSASSSLRLPTCAPETSSRRATGCASCSAGASCRTSRATCRRADRVAVVEDARKASILIHHDAAHPSRIVLPAVAP